jgi:hypothetical protein
MANEFVARNGVTALNNSIVSGSLNVTAGITGSLFGTSSWAVSSSFALTASFALNAGGSTPSSFTLSQTTPSTTWTINHNLNNSYPTITIYDTNGYVIIPQNILSNNVNQTTITFSYPATGYATVVVAGTAVTTASYAVSALTASYALAALTSSNSQTASYILNAVSASYAATASSADSFNIRTSLTASSALINGTITAQTLVVQTITSSISWITGSTKFGSLITDIHQFTGSISVSGSLRVVSGSITGSRINPRSINATSSVIFTPDLNLADVFTITSQSVALTFANPIGNPVEGQRMLIRIKDNATSRGLNFSGSQYRASTDLSFPVSSSANKTLYLGFVYHGFDAKWDLLAKLDNFA